MVGERPLVPLSKAVDIISGGTPKTTVPEFWNGDIPWLSVVDFNTGYRWVGGASKSITKRGLRESATAILNAGDIIISARGTVGVLAQLSRPMAFNQSCYGIRAKAGVSITDYIYYALYSSVARMKQIAHGGVFDTITKDTFNIIDIPLPPLPEQRAIAHILGALDDKIELNRRMNQTLEEIAQALFKSWFVDFDPVRANAEGRDAGLPQHNAELFPDSLEDSELGKIPRGWNITPLGELINSTKGVSYASSDLVESDTALVTLKSFSRGGGYRPEGLKSFAGSYKPNQVVTPGEIVVACTDVTQAAEVVGRPAMVRPSSNYQTLVASLDTLIIRPKDDRITNAFLYFLCGSSNFTAHTYAHTTGTTVLHLASNAVPSFRFALSHPSVVQAFNKIAAPLLAKIQIDEEENETLVSLRDSLLPKLISGEISIKSPNRMIKESTDGTA